MNHCTHLSLPIHFPFAHVRHSLSALAIKHMLLVPPLFCFIKTVTSHLAKKKVVVPYPKSFS